MEAIFNVLGKYAGTVNRILLGFVLLIPGMSKLGLLTWLSAKTGGSPAMVAGMFGDMLNFPAPTALAWLVIIAEVVGGVALIFNYKVKYAAIPAAIIMVVAAITVHFQADPPMAIPLTLVHLAVASNFLLIAGAAAGRLRDDDCAECAAETTSAKSQKRLDEVGAAGGTGHTESVRHEEREHTVDSHSSEHKSSGEDHASKSEHRSSLQPHSDEPGHSEKKAE